RVNMSRVSRQKASTLPEGRNVAVMRMVDREPSRVRKLHSHLHSCGKVVCYVIEGDLLFAGEFWRQHTDDTTAALSHREKRGEGCIGKRDVAFIVFERQIDFAIQDKQRILIGFPAKGNVKYAPHLTFCPVCAHQPCGLN